MQNEPQRFDAAPDVPRDLVHEHWDKPETESMDDKIWLAAETNLVRSFIPDRSRILECGCGEGETTAIYADIPGVSIVACDYSATRLQMALDRLHDVENVTLTRRDLRMGLPIGEFDVVLSQRFLINLAGWTEQKNVLLNMMDVVPPGGRIILAEGSLQGQAELNRVRKLMDLYPITQKWHNQFLDDNLLEEVLIERGKILVKTGFGNFFLLTRGFRQVFDPVPHWDHRFNAVAASSEMREILNLGDRFSRIRVWVWEKA